MSKFLDYNFFNFFLLFVLVPGNKKYNAQCEQFFKKLKELSKLSQIKVRKSQKTSGGLNNPIRGY